MSKDLQEAYFIRHKFAVHMPTDNGHKIDWKVTEELQKEAWSNAFAVIDYEEKTNLEEAFNPESYGDWKAAKNTINRVNKFLNTGGIVAISSILTHPTKLLIGTIPKNTKGQIHKFKAYPDYFFKIIPLKLIKEVELRNYPSLFSKIPRQTAFTRWPLAQTTLNHILTGEKPNLKSIRTVQNFLDASQLEIMCYEWLKENKKIRYLTLPIGRTMLSVDIVGINEQNKKVFAQVTFYNDKSQSKIDALKRVGESNDELYYFCLGETKLEDGLQYVSIEEVFDYFKNIDGGISFLKSLVGA